MHTVVAASSLPLSQVVTRPSVPLTSPVRLNTSKAVQFQPASPLSDRSLARGFNSGLVFPVVQLGAGFMGLQLRGSGFRSYTVPSCVGPLHVWDAPGQGSGPPVVVLHGLGGSGALYSPVLRQLLPHCSRVIGIDLPNHGSSASMGSHGRRDPAQYYQCKETAVVAVNQVLSALLGEPPILVGHSLGAFFAMRYALKQPTAGLVLVSPDGAPFRSNDLARLRKIFGVASRAEAREVSRCTWPQRPGKAKMFTPFVWAQFDRPEVQYLVQSDLLQPWLMPHELRMMPKNTCMIVGTHEAFDPPYAIDYLRRHLPAEHAFVQPPTSHGDITDGPSEIMEPIVRFIQSVQRGA